MGGESGWFIGCKYNFSINKFFGIKTYSRVIFNTFVILEFAIPLFRMLSNVVQGISIFSENFFMLPYLSMMRVFTFASRACLKNHSCNLHAPLCGRFYLHSVDVARYAALIQAKSPTNCDAHLAESLFQTRSSSSLCLIYLAFLVRS